MVRNLKVLGLALVAAMAMSAVVASAASAQLGKITSDGPVTLTGSETGGVNAFTAFGSEVQCVDHYTGHKTNTTNTLLASGETSVTIRPHYTNCSSPVNTNGCDYNFYDFTTVSLGTYKMDVDVVCPVGSPGIVVSGLFGCNTTVPPQKGLTGAHATNGAGGHINLVGTFTGIRARNVCFGETTTAQLHTDVTIRGLNSVGGPTPISISH